MDTKIHMTHFSPNISENTINGLIITGPTASGKTKLSINIAIEIETSSTKCCIINADSKQVYSQVPIITAQPTKIEQNNIDHKLFGFIDNDTALKSRYDATKWAASCEEIAIHNSKNNIFTIIIGGSMFYINAILNDEIKQLPKLSQHVVLQAEEDFKNFGREQILSIVQKLSPQTKTDTHRLLKNYAFILQYSQPIEYFYDLQSDCKQNDNNNNIFTNFAKIAINPPREVLYQWCNNRFNDMILAGVIDEVKHLYTDNSQIADAIYTTSGFKYIKMFLDGEINKQTMIEKSCQETRNYAKRQITWINNKLDKNFKIFDSTHNAFQYFFNH